MIKQPSLTLRKVVEVLRQHYGPPQQLPTADPFELILLENVAYLAPPLRRREAFELLRSTIGTTPYEILTADSQALEDITSWGILKSTFATKLRECAANLIKNYGGDLGSVLTGPLDQAKRALQTFPGIGEPGAEKILLFAGIQPILAPDSNGLRVLVRLDLVKQERSYARTYAASSPVVNSLSPEPSVMQEAHLLLKQHGQTLCKRGNPRCGICPLVLVCAYARDAQLLLDENVGSND